MATPRIDCNWRRTKALQSHFSLTNLMLFFRGKGLEWGKMMNKHKHFKWKQNWAPFFPIGVYTSNSTCVLRVHLTLNPHGALAPVHGIYVRILGGGCHSPLQGIFLTQGVDHALIALGRQTLPSAPPGKPPKFYVSIVFEGITGASW